MDDNDRKRPPEQAEEVVEIIPHDAPSENDLVIEHLRRMPTIFVRGVVYIILLFLVTAFLYAVLSRIDIVVEPRAVVRPASHIIKILCDRDGYLEKVCISEGDAIDEGAPLFFIRSKEALSVRSKIEELRHDIPLKQASYHARIAAALDELEQLHKNHRNTLTLKSLEREQNSLALASIEAETAYWHKEAEVYADMFNRMSTLLARGIVSMSEKLLYEVRLEKAQTEIRKLEKQKEIAMKKAVVIHEEIEKEKNSYAARKSVLEKDLHNLRLERDTTLNAMRSDLSTGEKMLSLQDQTLSASDRRTDRMIVAKTSGIVSELRFRNQGEYVRQSDLLCTILPANQPLYLDITVQNKDVGLIRPGMPVKCKFDAFPYAEHGTLQGTITAVSPSAVEDAALGMVYHAKGHLERTHFTIEGQRYPIKPGMTATAEIVVKRKSLFSILFEGFRK